MSVLELIEAKASQLPPEMQAEILDFVEFLARKNKPATTEPNPSRLPNKFGAGKELVTYIADDFDAPLDDLNEYMH